MRVAKHFLLMILSGAFALVAQAQLVPTDAEYAVILDYKSGEVLFEKDGYSPMIPASMTKIMTAHIVFERLRTGEITLEDRFTVSENAWREGGWASGGSTMGLKIGEQPTVEELLRGVIVLSGNDACIVLAEGLSGSEEAFADEMTALAQRMGLASASFKNASGLNAPGHEISAVDLAKIARASISEFPEYYRFYAEPEMTWNGIRQTNRNPILGRMAGVDGLKTGHLSVSGYGLVASAEREGKRSIIVINGLESTSARAQEAERLMRTALTAFTERTVGPEEGRLADLDVWLGESRTVGVTLAEPVSFVAHKRALPNAKVEIVYNGPLEAPISAGAEIAELVITVDGRNPITAPLIATESVEKLDFLGRAIEGLSRKMAPAS